MAYASFLFDLIMEKSLEAENHARLMDRNAYCGLSDSTPATADRSLKQARELFVCRFENTGQYLPGDGF